MTAMPAFRTLPLVALLVFPACDCEPPSDPERGSESTDTDTGSATDTLTDDASLTESGTDTNAESGEGSGEYGETVSDTAADEVGEGVCVDMFFTCENKLGQTLVCLTCPAENLIPCTCTDAQGSVVVCFAFDAASCG